MKVHGDIISQAFGEMHIQNDSIAFSEQIKNAVDANASTIILNLSDYEKGILIQDNGDGMSSESLSEEWNRVGGSSKSNDSEMLGGKGLGRFSLFRLAETMTIYSKTLESNPSKIVLNRGFFNDIEDISDIVIPVEEVSAQEWKSISDFNHGTTILLTGTEKLYLHIIEKELQNISNPLNKPIIDLEIIFPEDYSKANPLKADDALIHAPFKIKSKFRNGLFEEITSHVQFNDINEVINLNVAEFNEDLMNSLINIDEGYEISKSSLENLNEIHIEIHNFFFGQKFIKDHNIPKNEISNGFLKFHQGISIFRSNSKIFGFGENDFLKLAEKRLDRAGDNVDNKTTFGVVSLDKTTKSYLIEQTNREGFIVNDESTALNILITILVKKLGQIRKGNIPIIKGIAPSSIPTLSKTDKEVKLEYNQRNIDFIENRITEILIAKYSKFPIDNIEINKSDYNANTISPQKIGVKVFFESGDSLQIDFNIQSIRPRKSVKSLLTKDPDLLDQLRINLPKLGVLYDEILYLDYEKFPNACAITLRAVIEITTTHFLKCYQHSNPECGSVKGKFEYSPEEMELVRIKGQTTLNSNNRHEIVNSVFRAMGKNTLSLKNHLDNFVNNVNFTVHKEINVMSPSSINAFYSNFKYFLDLMDLYMIDNWID